MQNNSLEAAEAALKHFEETGELRLPQDAEARWDVYRCVFLDHKEAWQQVALEENRVQAQHSLKNIESLEVRQEPIDPCLHIVAMLAATCIGHFLWENGGNTIDWKEPLDKLFPQVAKIWCDTFKDYPAFQTYLKEHWNTYHNSVPFPESPK